MCFHLQRPERHAVTYITNVGNCISDVGALSRDTLNNTCKRHIHDMFHFIISFLVSYPYCQLPSQGLPFQLSNPARHETNHATAVVATWVFERQKREKRRSDTPNEEDKQNEWRASAARARRLQLRGDKSQSDSDGQRGKKKGLKKKSQR